VANRGPLKRHPLISYFVIAYGLAWAIEVPLALSANGVLPKLPTPIAALVIAAATFAPAAAAFIMTGVLDGKPGVVRLLRRLVLWRVGIQWYVIVLVGIPVIVLLAALVVPGVAASFQPLVGPMLAAYPLAFLMTVLLGGPLGEEPGWRGFALPHLQTRFGPLLGSVILGVMWALWHFPLFWSGVWTPLNLPNMVMFTVMITGLTIIMTWVFNHAKTSVLLTILMHASFNTFANKGIGTLFPAPILNDYGLLPVLIGFSVTALVLIVVTRGRLGYRPKAILA
jgi:membrane protease YdiL (CAAX protease family)